MAGRLAGRETYDIGFRAAVVAGAQGATETGSFIVGMRGDAEIRGMQHFKLRAASYGLGPSG